VILPDTNVLVRAFVPGSPNHEEVRVWLAEALSSEEPIALYLPILVGFVRIVTNPNLWQGPVPREDVWRFTEALQQGNVVWIGPGSQYWNAFYRLVERAGGAGGRITDIAYATVAIEHGCRIATFDRDFHRIPGITFFAPGGD
jgi:uncharacterized protein